MQSPRAVGRVPEDGLEVDPLVLHLQPHVQRGAYRVQRCLPAADALLKELAVRTECHRLPIQTRMCQSRAVGVHPRVSVQGRGCRSSGVSPGPRVSVQGCGCQSRAAGVNPRVSVQGRGCQSRAAG
eukprot:1195949-Prorocentrum_minimum.AAC.1